MSLLTRYITLQAVNALLLILASLTAVVWIAVALKQLKVVTSSGQDAATFLLITTLTVPNLIGFVAPVALLIATLHVLNRMNGDSELIIMTASGGSAWWIIRPFVILATIVSIVVFLVNIYAMPYSLRKARELVIEMQTNLVQQMLQPGQFLDPVEGITVHVRERTLGGQLKGILVHDVRKADEVVSLTAETGRVVTNDGLPYLMLTNGTIVRQNGVLANGQLIRFDNYPVELDEFQRRTSSKYHWKPRERYLGELLYPEPDDVRYKLQPGKMRAELHERFSSPLYPLAFVLIAIASIGQAQSTRSSRTNALVLGFVSAALLRLAGMTVNKLVVADAWAAPLLYAIPIAGAGLAIVAIVRNARPKPGPTALARIGFAIEDARLALSARLSRGRPAPASQS